MSNFKILTLLNSDEYTPSGVTDGEWEIAALLIRMGLEDRKLLLFDNFKCYKDGEPLGNIRLEVKKQMNMANG